MRACARWIAAVAGGLGMCGRKIGSASAAAPHGDCRAPDALRVGPGISDPEIPETLKRRESEQPFAAHDYADPSQGATRPAIENDGELQIHNTLGLLRYGPRPGT